MRAADLGDVPRGVGCRLPQSIGTEQQTQEGGVERPIVLVAENAVGQSWRAVPAEAEHLVGTLEGGVVGVEDGRRVGRRDGRQVREERLEAGHRLGEADLRPDGECGPEPVGRELVGEREHVARPRVVDAAFLEECHERVADLEGDRLELGLEVQRVAPGTGSEVDEGAVEPVSEPVGVGLVVERAEVEVLDGVFEDGLAVALVQWFLALAAVVVEQRPSEGSGHVSEREWRALNWFGPALAASRRVDPHAVRTGPNAQGNSPETDSRDVTGRSQAARHTPEESVASEFTMETAFETEAELRSIERELDRQRRALREELTAAFRRLNDDALHDVAEREYPFTTPEKRAVRRETVGPVQLLPEWEESYRDLADDQRTARQRLGEFHRDTFTMLADGEPYSLSVSDPKTNLTRPYLELRVRHEDRTVVLSVDNPVTEGYVYRHSTEYTERDVENALALCADIEDVDVDRLGLRTYNTELVDFTQIRNESDDPEQLRQRVQLEILETLESLDYEPVHTEESPLLAFIETVDADAVSEE